MRTVATRIARRLAGDESGFGLLELVVAMAMLAIGVAGLLSLYVATAVSLQRAGQKGTAVSLAEKQMEVYRAVPFGEIRLDGTQIPGGSNQYVLAHASDASIPSSTGQAVAGVNGDIACPGSPTPACAPVQTVTGPDHRSYRVDTYVEYVNSDATLSHRAPASGLTLKRVSVVVRTGDGTKILARASSTFNLGA